MKQATQSGKRKKALRVLTTILVVGALLYLGQVLYLLRADSPRGFVLPEGNIDNGQTAFVELGCVQCHTVIGITLPEALPEADTVADDKMIALGGTQNIAKTYGQLVTSVMHPSASMHAEVGQYVDAEGRSLMPDYTSQMTVEQLVDIVRFLQEYYDVAVPEYNPHIYYTPYDMGGPY